MVKNFDEGEPIITVSTQAIFPEKVAYSERGMDIAGLGRETGKISIIGLPNQESDPAAGPRARFA